MLTIKHITPMGNENVFEAHDVSYAPSPSNIALVGRHPSTGTLFYTTAPQSVSQEICDGTAYVMNDNGKTVARYEMGGWFKPDEVPEQDK